MVKVSQRQDHERMFAAAAMLLKTADPRIGSPLDFGVSPDGHFYHARIDLGGVPLAQWVAAPVAPDVVRQVMTQIVAAVSSFHEQCGPHGNLKPSNVLIHEDATGALDIAIVDPLGLSGQTQSASRPGIVAPETIENPASVQQESDVYAIGALLYLMLNGRPPYEGQTPNAILMKQLTEDHAPHGAGADATLSELADRCLRRRPGNRPSLEELQHALET